MTLRDLGEHFRDQRVNSPAVQRQVDASKQLFKKRTPDMTLRDELERILGLLRVACELDTHESWEEFENEVTDFLHAHGPALLEALVDAERLDWLQETYNQVSPQFPAREPGNTDALTPTGKWLICIRGTRSGVIADSLRQAIDRARGGGEKGNG